ncbi:MAG: alpha/beta hydrolase [Candidatus Omnitrophota bacterium]|jgi:hypothetical protein|nr:alpha/beta hydrolase [Candidatus Omnitrophota bacterium]
MKNMIKNIIYILIVAICVFGYLRRFEYKAIYFPANEVEFTPRDIGLDYEDVYIDTVDGAKLNTWFIPRDGAKYTLLFVHGNAGNIGDRIDKIELLHKLGLNIFIFDYRGYGKSKGIPSEKGVYRDAQAAYEYLISKKNVSPERIVPYGESLGGAIAIDLAYKEKVGALITESTFSSAKDMARVIYPRLPTFLILSKFDSVSKIKDIDIPKLIMHSKTDDVIPFAQSVKLFDEAASPKKHIILKGDHNSSHMDSRDEYRSSIKEFFEDL